MPFQFVNDSPTDDSVGSQIRSRSRASGMPTMRARTSLSWRVSRLYRRRGRAAATAALLASVRTRLLLWRQRVPELLHRALQARGIRARVGEEVEQELLHPVGSRVV